MNKSELAKQIGKNISGHIVCPACDKELRTKGQELMAVGDNENKIFCPHCELEFKIVIIRGPYE